MFVKKGEQYPAIFFEDSQRKELISNNGYNMETATLSDFTKLVIKNLVVVVTGIYGRHLINMLYPIFPSMYIKNNVYK